VAGQRDIEPRCRAALARRIPEDLPAIEKILQAFPPPSPSELTQPTREKAVVAERISLAERRLPRAGRRRPRGSAGKKAAANRNTRRRR
jgi:hypothetical protein